MLNIVCLRAGARFAPAYVNILFDSVRRNLAEGFNGKFICFTDQPDKLANGIEVRPLPADLPGWWGKLALHKSGVFPDGDRVLYLDLGCVLTGRLDEIAHYDGPFATLRDFYRPEGLQSAVMAWKAGATTYFWDTYKAAGCPLDFEINNTWGDQAWIENVCLGTAVRLQDKFPGAFVSYKLIKGPPEKASVVVFHGSPKPIDITDGWVPQVWQVNGMSRAELDLICNVELEQIASNIKSAIARDLPWFDLAPEHDGHVCIVGGGPSLKDTLLELSWRKSLGHKVWALNGAGHYLKSNGIDPDVIVMTDAREQNYVFVDGLDATAYLASQCHPKVFDHVKDAVVWHVNYDVAQKILMDERARPVHLIGGGSTVGMNALVLAFAAGYRKIHLYGFDSSYRESHHAYPQSMNDADRVIDALYKDERFKTAGWMAQQVNEFQDLVPVLVADGCVITVAGDGLLPTVARDMANAMPVTPAQMRALQIIERIGDTDDPRGAEIGVFQGEMSAALLRGHPGMQLDMVDSWEGGGVAYNGDSGDWHAQLSQTAQDGFFQQARTRTDFAHDRRTIIRGRSTQAAKHVKGLYDFVFLDADHSYDGCANDIAAWLPKIKPGGWLCGHDYENTSFPKFGVTQAVNEFVERSELSLQLGEHFCWFVQIPELASSQKGLRRYG